ncbi:uncharacterized protein LOC134249775 [Saccostrea cucullata]|uniref:uncharacterized protein LOC134249775 n=1 Tax=Saccostrea cuccullata TaxID=36930 RepID=UPI002ED390DF
MSRGDFSCIMNTHCEKSLDDEIHYNVNCKCKQRVLIRNNGQTVYVWYRICVCGYHKDRSSEYKNSELPDYHKDGIDIHENGGCIYKIILRRGCIWDDYKFVLECFVGVPGYNMQR